MAAARLVVRPDIKFNLKEAYELVMTSLVANLPGEPWKGDKKKSNYKKLQVKD